MTDERFPAWCGVTSFGGKCPVQGEGRIGDAFWYFRARGSRWTITVAKSETEAVLPSDPPLYDYEEAYGEWPAAGWMPDEEAIAFIVRELEKYTGRVLTAQERAALQFVRDNGGKPYLFVTSVGMDQAQALVKKGMLTASVGGLHVD